MTKIQLTDQKQALFRIEQLRSLLKEFDQKYYSGEQTIEDSTYDAMYRELQSLENQFPDLITSDSPTQRVSHAASTHLKKVLHSQPMISLYTEVDYTLQGAKDFHERVIRRLREQGITSNPTYATEPKYDGMSLRLRYVKNKLVQAITRGDGLIGEDVTLTAMTITNIPLEFEPISGNGIEMTSGKYELEVCGEVMIRRSVFNELCKAKEEKGEKPYANARNLVAGTMRQLDVNVARERKLVFYPYDVISAASTGGHIDNMDILSSIGFSPCWERRTAQTPEELFAQHENLANIRAILPYEIDGIVYKVNSNALRHTLGYTAREPRWAVAHKYAPEEAVSKVLDIEVQIGRTGKVTPVARIEPTFVGDVEVSNATLHNLSEVRRKGIYVGDDVVIRRAGDVIPEVVMSITTIPPWETDTRSAWQMPTECPLCFSRILLSEDLKQATCTGGCLCPGQTEARLIHFCSRKAMNIIGIADKTIQELLDKKMIFTAGDLMHLTEADFLKLEGVKETSAANMVKAIENSKRIEENKFLFALGIRRIGEEVSKKVLATIGSIQNLLDPDKLVSACTAVENTKGLGALISKELYEYFCDKSNLYVIDRIILSGVQLLPFETTTGVLTGKSFCVTGSFLRMSREQLEDYIQSHGGKIVNSVSSKTSYLVAGSGGGGKRDKALQMGVPIISEDNLDQLIQS